MQFGSCYSLPRTISFPIAFRTEVQSAWIRIQTLSSSHLCSLIAPFSQIHSLLSQTRMLQFPQYFFTLLPQLLSNLQARCLFLFSLFLWMLLWNLYNILHIVVVHLPVGPSGSFLALPLYSWEVAHWGLCCLCLHLGSAIGKPWREMGRLKEGRSQGISSPHSLPQTVSLMATVSPLGLQLLSERTFEPSAFAD